ncbi:unnamed protein product [Discosporangium mesarthrocarpum]
MDAIFDVVICEPFPLDFEPDRAVFLAWVGGVSKKAVVAQRLEKFKEEVAHISARIGKIPGLQLSFRRRASTAEETPLEEALTQQACLEALVQKDTADLYQVFDTLEHYLCQPEYLRGQINVQLGQDLRLWMVEKYHELDDVLVREVVGKKLTIKTRKDLDDVSEATKVPLRSCRRQYDNIRRVMTFLEETYQLQCRVVDEIAPRFMLPPKLAARYTALVFLFHIRFHVQSSKRLTAHMTADDLCWCAMGMINYWVGQGDHLGAFEVYRERQYTACYVFLG